MARLNNITQPRWNSPLIRFFGLKISGAAADTLAPEIQPGIDVNQQDDAQLQFLRGEKLAAYGTTMSAVPGFFSTGALRNPANSGTLIIVERIIAYSLTSVVSVSLSTIADLTNSGYCTPIDTRWAPLATLATAARFTWRNDSVGPLSGSRIVQIPPAHVELITLPIVLSPDRALIIETTAVNQPLTFGFQFRERAIPAEELSTG